MKYCIFILHQQICSTIFINNVFINNERQLRYSTQDNGLDNHWENKLLL